MSGLFFCLKKKIRNSCMGKYLLENAFYNKWGDILYKTADFFNLTDTKPSAEGMLGREKTIAFFQENKTRIQKISEALADEKSRQVYAKCIRYRETLNKKDRAEFSLYDQYFPKDVIRLSAREVFVDCGAYTGDTIKKFIRECKGKYKKIIAFEADTSLCEQINKNMPDIVVFNKGVWDKTAEMTFLSSEKYGKLSETTVNSSSLFTRTDAVEQNKITVSVLPMDSVPECADATFIKMDIEGAELPALKGAEKIIRQNKPKLAICIYHSNNDMIDIPEWVLGLNLGYKLYIRHHFGTVVETVLYAV